MSNGQDGITIQLEVKILFQNVLKTIIASLEIYREACTEYCTHTDISTLYIPISKHFSIDNTLKELGVDSSDLKSEHLK